jgi:regulatory protein
MTTEQTPAGSPQGDITIQSLVPPAQPGRAWTVLLSQGDTLRVPEGAVIDCALYAGKSLSPEELDHLTQAALGAAWRQKAASLLSSRLMSRGTLIEKLQRKGAEEEQAQAAADWAESIGLLNDEEYAKALVHHYQGMGYGYHKIRHELYHRKVPRELWEEALATMEGPEEAIQRFLASRLHDPTDRKQVKKASDALVRRGFSWHDVAAGIEAFKRDWEFRDE